MSDNALIAAGFAAARRELRRARAYQREALLAAMDMYRGGARGHRARLDFAKYDRLRAVHLESALTIRMKTHALRVIVTLHLSA